VFSRHIVIIVNCSMVRQSINQYSYTSGMTKRRPTGYNNTNYTDHRDCTVKENINTNIGLIDVFIQHTRGHKYKLYKSLCRCNTRRFFFTEHVINVWNLLPSTVNFSSLASFKTTIRKVDLSEFLAF